MPDAKLSSTDTGHGRATAGQVASPVLGLSLSSDFNPGSNVKGNITGATWSFLLPRLELDRIVCIGVPEVTALQRLSHVAQRVDLACHDRKTCACAAAAVRRHQLENIHPFVYSVQRGLPLPDASADVLVLVDAAGVRRLTRDPLLKEQCRQLLKPDGVAYVQAPYAWQRTSAARKLLTEMFGSAERLWLTPFGGELSTAVPADDAATVAYFLEQRLEKPSVTPQRCRRAFRRCNRTRGESLSVARPADTDRVSVTSCPRPATRRNRKWMALVRRSGRTASNAVFGWCQRAEARLLRCCGERFRREGVFAGGQSQRLAAGPPEYLTRLAEAEGCDIGSHRWAFAAKGEYSSRKLLFLLFRRDAAANAVPDVIVKMVRDSRFNARLEREADALVTLRGYGVGDRETLPQVAFAGRHGGLAIVGETVIDGVPFDQRSQFTGLCPYARAAVDFLIDLSAATADRVTANTECIAVALNALLERFLDIYHVSPQHTAFLRRQIAAIAESPRRIPLVFQHGDPGRWNVFAVGSSRAAFLDWESAEPKGMPLWDLFYFLRSYCVGVGKKHGITDSGTVLADYFIGSSPLSPLVIQSTARYCQRTGLPTDLVEPLFYTCWIHRALKETLRLSPQKLQHGHYFQLLQMCIERRDAPILRNMFDLRGRAWESVGEADHRTIS